jgi:hypothetical protein
MPASDVRSYADEVVHIMATYNLRLPREMLESMAQGVRDSGPGGLDRLAEEEAAILLARNLHAVVMAELCSGIDSRAMGGTLGAWSKFSQQTMYRADLGLINKVLYRHEILPLIDDVERLLRERLSDADIVRSGTPPRPTSVPF